MTFSQTVIRFNGTGGGNLLKGGQGELEKRLEKNLAVQEQVLKDNIFHFDRPLERKTCFF